MTLPDRWVAVRLSALGDVVLTTGPLAWWARARGWRFTFVTRRAWAPLLQGHPAVDEVVALDEADLQGRAWVATGRRLAGGYGERGLLDLHGVLRTRILSALWPGPVRRYPKFGLARRMYLRFGSARAGRVLRRYNVVERYAMAVPELLDGGRPPGRGELAPRVFLDEHELALARDLARPVLERGRPLAALHPFATHPNKAWPRERWTRLAGLLDRAGWSWLALGRGQSPLEDAPGGLDLINRTDLRQSCAVLSLADVLVTPDSGPMHLASAVGTPVVALFGPTDPAWGFYPFGPLDRVLELDLACRPCSLHGREPCGRDRECLSGIAPETVLAAAQSVRGASTQGNAP